MLARAPARGCVWSGTSWQEAVLVCAPETTEEQTRVRKSTLLQLVCRHKHSSNTRTSSYQATALEVQDSVRSDAERCITLSQGELKPSGRMVLLNIYSKSSVLAALTGIVQFFSSTSQAQRNVCESSSGHGASSTAQCHIWQQRYVTRAKTSAWQMNNTSSSACRYKDPGSLLTSP